MYSLPDHQRFLSEPDASLWHPAALLGAGRSKMVSLQINYGAAYTQCRCV